MNTRFLLLVLLPLLTACASTNDEPFNTPTSTTSTEVTQDSRPPQVDAGQGGQGGQGAGSSTSTGGSGGQAGAGGQGGQGQGGSGGQGLGGQAAGGQGGQGGLGLPDAGQGGQGQAGQGGQGGQGGAPVVCSPETANCNGNPADGCEVSINQDPKNCGACGTVCAFKNAGATCKAGSCQLGTCNQGFADCNLNAADGCETKLDQDIFNCGACGTVCSGVGGTPVCQAGKCQTVCKAGAGDCTAAPGCETNLGLDPTNCGTCGNICQLLNASSKCQGGTCQVSSCAKGFLDCDGNPADGCETDITTMKNCGGCGVACDPATQFCQNQACTSIVCAAGSANCDGVAANGCETALGTLQNCSGCGNACQAPANSTATCSSFACGFTCQAGFLDCDKNAANGCEVGDLTDTNNCGACGTKCAVGGSCQAGACKCPGQTPMACQGACRDLASDVLNCGGCGTTCQIPNAAPACQAGACQIGSCNQGTANCDGQLGNGCEINTLTDAKNCGACGHDCQGGTCTAGMCGPVKLATCGQCGLAVNATYLYMNGGWLERVPTAGGAQEFLHKNASGTGGPIVLDQTNLFWNDNSNMMRGTLDGVTTWVINTQVGSLSSLASDALYLYWASDGSVMRALKSNLPVALASNQGLIGNLTIDTQNVYWTVGTEIRTTPIKGGAVTTIVSNLPSASALAVDAQSVYWTDAVGTVNKAPLGGGAAQTLVGGQTTPVQIAVDASHIYWLSMGVSNDGTVMRANLDGSKPTTLVAGLAQPNRMVTDAKTLYWENKGDGGIWKIAK